MIDKEIIKIASNTENHGVLDNHTHFSKLKNARTPIIIEADIPAIIGSTFFDIFIFIFS